MATIRLAFLDQLSITSSADQPVTGLPRKLVALLGLLAVERSRMLPVERACRLLWPEAGDALARKSLNQLLVRARVLLPGVLERPDEQHLLLAPVVASDVHDLLFGGAIERLAGPPTGASYELLPGFSVRSCPELNDWLDATRVLVRTRAAGAALERAGSLSSAASYPWATLAYGLDRADDRAAAAYFRALSAVQGPAAAWAAFLEHRRWLAEALDISPSARLTAAVADACRQEGRASSPEASGPEPGTLVDPPAPAPVATPAPSSIRRWRRPRLPELASGLAVLAVLVVLSAIAWQTMRTPPVSAGTEVALPVDLARAAAADSAVRLAAADLRGHGVGVQVLSGASAPAVLRISAGDGASRMGSRLAVAPVAGLGATHLAGVLADSVLGLVARAGRPAEPRRDFAGPAAELLRQAHASQRQAGSLAATGGEGAALEALARADSLAGVAARRQPRDWQALLLQAGIANQLFWSRVATGLADPAPLRRGVRLAAAAVRLGGGNDALDAHASLNFSLWVSGMPGAQAAGDEARRDYAALVRSAPARGEAWSRLALLYHAEGRLGDAYSAALASLPLLSSPEQRLEAFGELFQAALDRGDLESARKWCGELAFHAVGSWLVAHCTAMYAWADPFRDMPLPPTSLTGEPDALRPSLHAQLALLHAGASLARGDSSAAGPLIERARPLIGQDPELASTWAGVLVALGKQDSALATLRAYLAGAPSRTSILGRPWLRPLYRPQESWSAFRARLRATPPT